MRQIRKSGSMSGTWKRSVSRHRATSRLYLRYMHDHAADGHGVKEILPRFPIDRRKLERWFRRNLGRSPFEEIQRLRIAQVKRLLSQTEESTEEIVRRCGFSSVKTLSRTFCCEVGVTLSTYRKQFKRSSMGHE
jgi:LacI family transcriptional regulator